MVWHQMIKNLTSLIILWRSGGIHRMDGHVLLKNGARSLRRLGCSSNMSSFSERCMSTMIWTARSRMSAEEKAKLAQFMLASSPRIQSYFEIVRGPEGQLESFTNDFIFVKGRKV